jgi:hypothetical protein
MILISWNCRGIGHPQTVRDLCQLVKDKKPSILFLIETISQKHKMEWLRVRLGFEGLLAVDPVGRSRGLALFWKEDVGLEIQNYSHRHITVVIQGTNFNKSWRFTGFYGHPDTSKRDESWALLRHLEQFTPCPWLCICDFNEITQQSEKEGVNLCKDSQMAKFREVIENCALSDLGFFGSKFTWSNGHRDGSFMKERLDRALANAEWDSLFKAVEVRIEARCSSNHNPVLVEFTEERQERRSGPSGFKFEAKWWVDEECGLIIHSAWENDVPIANPITDVRQKLDHCRRALTRWNRRKFGDVDESLKKKTKELVQLQQVEHSSNQDAIKKIQSEIDAILEQEDSRWKQRTKQHWYMHGDKNTQFFHA